MTSAALKTETEILDRVRDIIAEDEAMLNMDVWHEDGKHDCGTAHCLAGWAQALSGEDGDVVEVGKKLLPRTACMPGFFCSGKVARAWLLTRGYADDRSSEQFREQLVGLGWRYANEGVIESGGDSWLDGNATLSAQSGGVSWLDGNATLSAQSGGDSWLYGNATLSAQSGGDSWLYGNATLSAQSGGDSRLDGNATLSAQSGGVSWLDGNATLSEATDVTIHVLSKTAKLLGKLTRCTVITEEWTAEGWREVSRVVHP